MTENGRQMFFQILEKRDLSRAGQLFSVEDVAIRFYSTDLLRKIEEIVDTADYDANANDQGVVEICITRVLSCIRDTNTIDQHIVAMVSLLETCASHDLSCHDDSDTPHTKLVRDLLGCIFLHSNHRLILQLALPVTCKFLTMQGNPELMRHVASYVSLACVNHAELVAQNAATILECILQNISSISCHRQLTDIASERRRTQSAQEFILPFTLVRLLPTLYAFNREPIKARIGELLPILASSRQLREDTATKRYVLELIDALIADQPSLLFDAKTIGAARIIELYDDSTVEQFARFLAAATSDWHFAEAFASDEAIDQLQLAALRWASTRTKCVRLVHQVARRSKQSVAHCVAILIGLLLSGASSVTSEAHSSWNGSGSWCTFAATGTPICLELTVTILADLLDVLTFYHRSATRDAQSSRAHDTVGGDPVLAPAINQLTELCALQAHLVPYALHADVAALLDRIRIALSEYCTRAAERCNASVTLCASASERRSVAIQTSGPPYQRGSANAARHHRRTLSESCAHLHDSSQSVFEAARTSIPKTDVSNGVQSGSSSVPNLVVAGTFSADRTSGVAQTDVVNIHSTVPQPALNKFEQIRAYVRATRHEIPAPCSCRTEPRSAKPLRKRGVAGLLPNGVLNLGVSEPPAATLDDTNCDPPPDRAQLYSLFLQFCCECASPNCLYKDTANLFTIRTKHARIWLHFHFLCFQAAADGPLQLNDSFSVHLRRVCEQTLLAKQRDPPSLNVPFGLSNSPTRPSPAEHFPALVHAFSTAFPNGRQIATMRREMSNALYFDVFQYDRARRAWTCFLCRQFLDTANRVTPPLAPADDAPLLNDGFSDDLEVDRPSSVLRDPVSLAVDTKTDVPPVQTVVQCPAQPDAPAAQQPRTAHSHESRRRRTNGDTQLILEGKVKEKRGYWSIFRRWKTRYFTLSGGHLLTIATPEAHPQSSTSGTQNAPFHPNDRDDPTRSLSLLNTRQTGSNANSVTKKIQSFRPLRNRASRKPKAFEIFTNDQQKLLIKPDQRDAERWERFLQTGLVRRESQTSYRTSVGNQQ